ncbi:MAG TPA: collagen-like protein [Anaerolineales bacterium]
MSIKKVLLIIAVLLAAAFVLAACAGPAGSIGPAGPAGPVGPTGPAGAAGANPSAADLTCTQCHNNTNLITSKAEAWATSLHGSGTAFLSEGPTAGCAGCHSGSGFLADLAAGLTPDKSVADPNPTQQDCRTCHTIHTTYTNADFALTTTGSVTMYATTTTYDGGEGNLCANCHQARRVIPAAAADGTIAVTIRFGPHHGPQSDMLLGVGGAGAVTGTPSPHYSTVPNTCVTCHMGDNKNHTFAPDVATCVTCHAGATSFDMNGAITALDGKIATLKAALTTAGLLDKTGAIVAGNFPEAQANALWNYLLVGVEDKSHGVHNMPYANALLDASLAVFGK